MDFAEAVRQLYGTPPPRFVAARTDLARRAADDGDRDLAARVKALRRPSAAAWAVNLLAADGGLDELAQLGDRFRAAQRHGDRDEVGRLSAERKAALADLTSRARGLASDAGAPLAASAVTDLDGTLRAVVADEGAAGAARSGALVRALAADGVDEADLDDAVAGEAPSRPRPRPARRGSRDDDRAARRRSAEQAADEAERAAEQAESERDDVEARWAELGRSRDEVADGLRRLRDEFAAVEARQRDLDDQEKFLRRERRRAGADATSARRDADRARGAVED